MIELDSINQELDPLPDKEFDSAQDAWDAVSLTLEKNNIEVPTVEKFENEMVFQLKLWDDEGDKVETPHALFLYVCLDHNDETVYHIYATICDQKDLDLMQHVDDGDDEQDTPDE